MAAADGGGKRDGQPRGKAAGTADHCVFQTVKGGGKALTGKDETDVGEKALIMQGRRQPGECWVGPALRMAGQGRRGKVQPAGKMGLKECICGQDVEGSRKVT